MAEINLRVDKERPLTIEEVDGNFDAINREVGTKLSTASFNAVNILALLEDNAGAGSKLNADTIHGYYPSKDVGSNTAVIRDINGNIYAAQVHGVHIGDVIGSVTGNLTGNVTGNATNVSGTVQVDHGGTGSTTAQGARSNLGLGSMAVQNSVAIEVTGGTITGITDLAVADGGTGASNSSGARSNLGLVIGADVQAYNAVLAGISGTSGDGFVVRTTTGAASARTLVAGNSIEITNPTGKDGNPTIAMSATPSVTAITKFGTNGAGNIGQTDNRFNVIYGKSTSAQYADLAERYTTDSDYAPGTVMVVSMDDAGPEATQSYAANQRVLGVISTAPAHIMNDSCDGPPVALRGRVPVKVVGAIRKGEPLISTQDGKAIYGDTHNTFAIALETNKDAGVKLVECVIL